MTKIAYEPHPVTPERKKELREQGFKIIDERFKPDHLKEAEAPERITPETIDSMKKKDVVDLLKEHGVEDPEGSVAELREKAKQIIFI